MGRDKASLRLGPPFPTTPGTAGSPLHPEGRLHPEDPGAAGDSRTLAERTADILTACCSTAVEVGPGHSGLRAVTEDRPGEGPLAAVAAGWQALKSEGWQGPVIVVATDLPRLTERMVVWLAGRPGERSVVPVASGRVQPLCARYSPADLDAASDLVAGGGRSMRALLETTDPELVPEEEWAAVAGGAQVLADVDTPEDLRRVTGP